MKRSTSSIILAFAGAASASLPIGLPENTYKANPPTVAMPIQVSSGPYGKVVTEVSPSYNSSEKIRAIYDLGSDKFIMFESGSKMNWGCPYLSCQGKCNVSVPEDFSYDPRLSTTLTDEQPTTGFYGYGGGLAKIYKGNETVNDTFIFTNAAGYQTEVPNVQVALTNYLQQRIQDMNGTCQPVPTDYSESILGVGPYVYNVSTPAQNTLGPPFRKNLLDTGRIPNLVQSMWFEQAPADRLEPFTGVGLIGGIDTSKYTGPLVKIPIVLPPFTGYSYYTNPANMSVNGAPIRSDYDPDTGTGVDPHCLIDSGWFGEGINPSNVTEFLELTGLVENPKRKGGGLNLAWPGPCETVPADRNMEYTFQGVDPTQSVTVKVPFTSYARNQDPDDTELGWCTMSMYYYGCYLGSIFLTSAFFAADDEAGWMAIAQGAVAPQGSGVDYSSIVATIP